MSNNKKDIEKLPVPVWNGSGKHSEYERWSILIKIRLEGKKIAEPLTTDLSRGSDDDKMKDVKPKVILLSCTSGTAFNMIKKLTNAKAMWDKLENHFGTAPTDEDLASDLMDRWAKLNKMNQDKYDCPDNWMEAVTNCATDLESLDAKYKIDPKMVKFVLVNGLPNLYEEKRIRRDLLKDVNDATKTPEDLKQTIHREWKVNFKGKKPAKSTTAYATRATNLESGEGKPVCLECG